MGIATTCHTLSEQVMRLEQLITTGGCWQDQAGGTYPGAKLMIAGPGLHRRVRLQPVRWTQETQAEFESLVVLYSTRIRRVARGLLRRVGRYFARETACLPVLHSIKTMAMEMAPAPQDGEWDRLGELLGHPWELNRILEPNTANAPVNALLEAARPLIRGAKIAGAGGGGFPVLPARSPAARREPQMFLGQNAAQPGGATDWHIASEGLRVKCN
jgi:fucokinase